MAAVGMQVSERCLWGLVAWELELRLEGYRPDVARVAIPALTHAIHARLAERRASEAGEPAPMDQVLAALKAL